jgi:hypothetical protein
MKIFLKVYTKGGKNISIKNCLNFHLLSGDTGDRGEKGDRGFTTTINSDGQFPTGIIEGPPGPPGNYKSKQLSSDCLSNFLALCHDAHSHFLIGPPGKYRLVLKHFFPIPCLMKEASS